MKEQKDKSFYNNTVFFEYSHKVKDHSFWRKLYSSDSSTERMKRTKTFGLRQVIHLNLSKGYLDNQKVNWGISEIHHFNSQK